MNRSYSKIRHIQEANIRLEKRLIQEQSVPLLTVLANPTMVSMAAENGTSMIYLTQRDAKGNVVPGSKYSYEVEGKYGFVTFDVSLHNVKRLPNGDLSAQVYPKSRIVQGLLDTMVDKKYKTPEGWLYIQVPNAKINEAIEKLKQNKGEKAVMDAGSGIKITLKLVE